MLMGDITSRQFDLMRSYIEEECGIALGKEKAYLITNRLSGLLTEYNIPDYEGLYYTLKNKKDPHLKERVIDSITTNETLWFRDKTPFRTLEEVLLPKYIEEVRAGGRNRIRIWSAGCSTGQEPYSIAMLIDRYLAREGIRDVSPGNFEILATDISRRVLKIAEAGKYDDLSIARGLDLEYRSRYFTREGRDWVLDKGIRDRVEFKQFNLQNNFVALGKFDVIFCRYVTIYFSPDLKREIFRKIATALNRPWGVLFLGSSEVFTGYGDYFTRMLHNGGVYYKVKE
jgi:chemotaxis protein methyltransferase CheR